MAAASFAGSLLALLILAPLVWKWDLGFRRAGPGLVAIALAAGGAALGLGEALGVSAPVQALLGAAATLAGATAVLAWRFYRDPERSAPDGDGLIVSPADGEVVYVRRSRGGRLPVATKLGSDVALEELTRTRAHTDDAVVIGVAMSFLDVHVNRAPIAGRVLLRRHFPGRFGSLRVPEAVFENERATTLISNDRLEVAVVQIASRLVRQIASFVAEGEEVAAGQRIGVIRLGSQVDLVLPASDDLQVLVREGDRVLAGATVLAAVSAGDARAPVLAGEAQAAS